MAQYIQANYTIDSRTKIAIGVRRSFDMIIGVLGILKSGAAYVPLDPNNPVDRLHYIYETAGASLIIVQEDVSESIEKLQNSVNFK